ncbi:MAG: hypothetical protein MJE68_28275, partial [Proteobacteria bacterium]|nr:hypothetical protein [Pseudomonadota bacterium]
DFEVYKNKTELAKKVKQLYYEMGDIANVSITLLRSFSDVSEIRETIPSVKDNIREQHSDFQLIVLMQDMDDILRPALKYCEQIQEKCKQNKKEGLGLAELAAIQSRKAEDRQTETGISGGVGSAFAITGAITTAILAVFVVYYNTMGQAGFTKIAIIAIVMILAGVSLVLGSYGFIAVGVTVNTFKSLGKHSKALQKLREDSQAIARNAHSLNNKTFELHVNTKKIITALERLKERGTQQNMNEEKITVVCQTLDQLDASSKCLSKNVHKCEKIFADLKKQLQEIDVEI